MGLEPENERTSLTLKYFELKLTLNIILSQIKR